MRNPWDHALVPGGSSGGSAAAVAARIAPAATGTDTGGSIRQPAALSGITGFKPTYGRVSRYGMIAFASSLDQAGVLTQSAEDAALLLEAMAGFDERDSTSLDEPVPRYSQIVDEPWDDITIGVPESFFDDGLDADNAKALRAALAELEKLGAKLKSIELPNIHLSVPAYYVVAPAEASSNLSRFDGVRFGHRAPRRGLPRVARAGDDLTTFYMRNRGEGFGAEVKRRILTGTYVLSAGYFDAYYLQAQKVRKLISDDFARAFRDVDFVAGPTTPSPAFGLGPEDERPDRDVLERHLHDRREPRRPAGDVDAVRFRAQPARRLAARRAAVGRSAAAQGRAPLPTSHGLAPTRAGELRVSAMDWEIVIGLEIHAQLATKVQDLLRRVDDATARRRTAKRASSTWATRACCPC